jgi:hypothetical protein
MAMIWLLKIPQKIANYMSFGFTFYAKDEYIIEINNEQFNKRLGFWIFSDHNILTRYLLHNHYIGE